MHAALFLTTLIFGAPVLPHSGAGDPASEVQGADTDILGFADGLLRIGARLIQSDTLAEYLRTLDLAVLEFEISPWFEIFGAPEHVRQALDSTPERAAAVHTLVQVVDPAWRAELREGLEDALRLINPDILAHPTVQQGVSVLTDPANDPLLPPEGLGNPDRPPSVRRALLAYMRGFLGTTVLAVAADRGTQLPSWLAAAVIPPWRAFLRQLHNILDGHELTSRPFGPELLQGPPDLKSTDAAGPAQVGAMASVLTAYQCRDGRRLAPYFQRDPALAEFLRDTREQLSRYFPDASIERIWLAASHDPDDLEDLAGLEITVFTRQDPDTARSALAAFDEAWWLEHCDRSPRIVVDTHLV